MRLLGRTPILLALLLGGIFLLAWAVPPVMVQNYETDGPPPTVWVVNIPNENASVRLSKNAPYEGKKCLTLHYHFVGKGNFEYLGVPNKTKIQAPIHTLRFMLSGDKSGCSYGLRLLDASGETHQWKGGVIDFTGWKDVVFDLDAPHETWDGDKNGKLDYPLTEATYTLSQPSDKSRLPLESEISFDALRVTSDKSAEEVLGSQIAVTSPAYCADIKGNTRVTLAAPGFKSVTVTCWKQGGAFG